MRNRGKSRIVLTETTPGAWIDFEHLEVRFLKSTAHSCGRAGATATMHLYVYSFDMQNPMGADAKLESQLTRGDFEVLSIEEWTKRQVRCSFKPIRVIPGNSKSVR